MNYGKIAMLHRLGGRGPISIYSSTVPEDVEKLYAYLQELCNNSLDLKIDGSRIVSANPLLAWHLREVVREQTMVPQASSPVESGSRVVEII